MPIYTQRNETVANLVSNATSTNTLLIPNLQRPYVWKHSEVIELLDSLFKGWPFGTLLLWDLGQITPNQALVPSRGFYQVVDRTDGGAEIIYPPAEQPNNFKMVLDGQQRLQSMILALVEGTRLRQKDQAWRETRGGQAVRWQAGFLCFNLNEVASYVELTPYGMTITNLQNYSTIMEWVQPVGNHNQGDVIPGYIPPLKVFNSDTHVRLSQLYEVSAQWQEDLNVRVGLARDLLRGNGAVDVNDYKIFALQFLLTKMHEIRTTEVRYLEISSQAALNAGEQQNYMSSIVEIFARLNTAGRTLTKEDIIFAWLRQYWPDVDERCKDIQNVFAENEGKVSNEDVIKIITHTWGMVARDGRFLDSEELRQVNVISEMANWCNNNINYIVRSVSLVLSIPRAQSRIVFGNSYKSINALVPIVAMSTKLLISANGVLEEQNVTNNISQDISQFFPDWIYLTQWLGIWSSKTDRAMSQVVNVYKGCDNISTFVKTFMSKNHDKLISYINELGPDDRSSFATLTGVLKIWLKSSPENIHIFDGLFSNNFEPVDVDHIVPVAWFSVNMPTVESRVIHSLGNSMLLPRGINIAKGSNLYSGFGLFNENRDCMRNGFLIGNELFSADGGVDNMTSAIYERAQNIKNHVISYVKLNYPLPQV